jgi:hypothetical protein
VRVVLDNVNNTLLAALNQGALPPFEHYANRNDVLRFTSRIAAVMTGPPRCADLEGA